ncbi:MAG: hypothetical protein EB015_07310 [Methylocystaceae bacterium]|nr:hypothetical protein [Methylocystaceae bacterium]
MDMTIVALGASLLAAMCQTITDLGTKTATNKVDDTTILAVQWLSAACLLSLTTLTVYPNLIYDAHATITSLIKPGFITLIFSSVILNILAYIFYIRSYRLSDASLIAPLTLLTPVLMLITSPIMVGEQTPIVGIIGVVLTVIGVGLLDAKSNRFNFSNYLTFLHDPGARFMLIAAMLWSITANIDKLGVRASNPLLWITSLTIIIAICASIYWLIVSRRSSDPRKLFYTIGSGGALALGNLSLVWAMSISFTPYVIAIKRLSALTTVLIGGKVLNENIKNRFFGASVMFIGSAMIILARSS